MLRTRVNRHAADCGSKTTECRRVDIVAKQSDCIVSSRKTNITGTSFFDTRISANVTLAAAEALGQVQSSGNMRIVNGENPILGLAASRSHRHTPPPDMPAARFNKGASRGGSQ